MDMIFIVIAGLGLGFGVGCWWYRRMLVRDPDMLERLAQAANALGKRL